MTGFKERDNISFCTGSTKTRRRVYIHAGKEPRDKTFQTISVHYCRLEIGVFADIRPDITRLRVHATPQLYHHWLRNALLPSQR
jgi:hypothetical protein